MNHGAVPIVTRTDGLWALCAYFNPLGYRRRRENFAVFRRNLGIPLLVVELGFGGRFDLGQGDAEELVQLEGGDLMWQKERLLNLGLARLPRDCRAVATVDADVVFDDVNWHQAALAQLEGVPVLQLFTEARFLGAGEMPRGNGAGVTATQRSTASVVAAAADPIAALAPYAGNSRGSHTPGFGWAFRRELLDVHGLFDACIVGGGDRAMSAANWGAFEAVETRMAMHAGQRRHFRAWAEPWYEAVRGRVGHLEGALYHLWHGDLENRRYGSRYLALAEFGFDPATDITCEAGGAWRWASDKPGMHGFMADYFASRREDG